MGRSMRGRLAAWLGGWSVVGKQLPGGHVETTLGAAAAHVTKSGIIVTQCQRRPRLGVTGQALRSFAID
eukprot:SAG31_NODE_24069_length_490_cov_0.644501_2_plen_68_part_01